MDCLVDWMYTGVIAIASLTFIELMQLMVHAVELLFEEVTVMCEKRLVDEFLPQFDFHSLMEMLDLSASR